MRWHFSPVAQPLLNPLLSFLLHLCQFALRLLREFSHLGHGFDCVVTKLWNPVEIAGRVEAELDRRYPVPVVP